MDDPVESRKEAMMKRLASRHEKRLLSTATKEPPIKKKIDLRATEKAFLDSSPSTMDMKTPIQPAQFSITTETISSSPILSFDEKANKQIVALATWSNTMLGLENSNSTEELDLGATKAEACRRIQKMLSKKSSDSDVSETGASAASRRRFQRIFERNDSEKIKKQCKKLLIDSGIEQSVKNLLSRNSIAIRNEHSVYNDLALQTTLLRTFLSFHPAWLKVALETILDAKIDAQPKYMIRALSQCFIERVFSNPSMLKNKKFAQGSGKPIITPSGREALHHHFLSVSMKLMFLIESAYTHRFIPNLTRIFTKSSQFKSLDDVFTELTKELLTGSSATFRKAFAKIGFVPSYKQSFIENYDYQAKGFDDFSDGLILAKLIETVGEMPHATVLKNLRDPAGDRIRKINNVKMVLQEMTTMGISTEDVTAAAIVGGKKESILAILWSIVGVRVAKEKKIRIARAPPGSDMTTPKKQKRRSGVHDDMSSEVLKLCKQYGRELNLEVLDVDSLIDGLLLEKIWITSVPNWQPLQSYTGDTLWDKIVTMAELELGIPRGLDQNVALFVKMFLEKTSIVKKYNEQAAKIQKAWKTYLERKNMPKLYSIVQQALSNHQNPQSPRSSIDMENGTFTIQKTPRGSRNILKERPSISQFSLPPATPQSQNSTLNDATFTVSRDSMDSLSNVFKMPRTPKTPLRSTFTRTTISKHIEEIIEEDEETENDETVVPSTLKKRVRMGTVEKRIFERDREDVRIEKTKILGYSEDVHVKKIGMDSDDVTQKTSDDVKQFGRASEVLTTSEDVTSQKGFEIPDDVTQKTSDNVKSFGAISKDSGALTTSEDNVEDVTSQKDFEKSFENLDDVTQKTSEDVRTITEKVENLDFSEKIDRDSDDVSIMASKDSQDVKDTKVGTDDVNSNKKNSEDVAPSSEDVNSQKEDSEDVAATKIETEDVGVNTSMGILANGNSEKNSEDVEKTPEDDSTQLMTLTPKTSQFPMDFTQQSTENSVSSFEEVVYEKTDEQKQNDDWLNSLIDEQKDYVRRNDLDLVIQDQSTQEHGTPELRRILRETRELKRKQQEIFQAKKLGAIEKRAIARREDDVAFMECSTAYETQEEDQDDDTNRSDAGHDDAIIIHHEDEENGEILNESMGFNEKIDDENEKKREKHENSSAILIQKMIRGFLARRRFRVEIENWRHRMIVYNQVLAQENEQFERDETMESSVEIKLRNCALNGLTNDHLHIVHIAATIIDRITDLVPSLLEKFVVELNGIKLISDILDVADQGFAYTSILQPLLKVLQKSFLKVPEEATNASILPILPKLSPRLKLLMCKHSNTKEFFIPIITTLISIARRFPTKKESHLGNSANYAIDRTMKKVTDQDGTNLLITLRNVCDNLM